MKKKRFVPDTYARVERRNRKDSRSVKEQILMEEKTKEKISFGVFSVVPPKPNDRIAHFTIAFSQPIKKSELYPKLAEALGDHWDGEPTKSIFLHLTNPLPWRKTRVLIKKALEKLLL